MHHAVPPLLLLLNVERVSFVAERQVPPQQQPLLLSLLSLALRHRRNRARLRQKSHSGVSADAAGRKLPIHTALLWCLWRWFDAYLTAVVPTPRLKVEEGPRTP